MSFSSNGNGAGRRNGKVEYRQSVVTSRLYFTSESNKAAKHSLIVSVYFNDVPLGYARGKSVHIVLKYLATLRSVGNQFVLT